MGKTDLALNQVMERKEVFADFVNGIIYGGRQVVEPEKLEMLSGRSGVIYEENGKKTKALERYGDIRMKADMGTYSIIFANENQLKVHYAMPVRSMLYDALEYVKQIEKMEKEHTEAGDKLPGASFLSGITKEDKLMPVITIVLFLGDEWDGARSLYEMLGIDENDRTAAVLKKYLPDYEINLVCAQEIENINWFGSCLQQIFGMLKWKKDKKKLYQYIKDNRENFKKFDYVEMMAAMVLLGEQKRVAKLLKEKETKKEEFDVCQAIDELIEDGRRAGMSEGRRQGKQEGKREGKREGKKIGQHRINSLNQKLKEDGRIDELFRSIDDVLFQKKLLKEYGL